MGHQGTGSTENSKNNIVELPKKLKYDSRKERGQGSCWIMMIMSNQLNPTAPLLLQLFELTPSPDLMIPPRLPPDYFMVSNVYGCRQGVST